MRLNYFEVWKTRNNHGSGSFGALYQCLGGRWPLEMVVKEGVSGMEQQKYSGSREL
jgi:hypothetical protein